MRCGLLITFRMDWSNPSRSAARCITSRSPLAYLCRLLAVHMKHGFNLFALESNAAAKKHTGKPMTVVGLRK